MSKKILLSGAKPTGIPHIGNYFGALKQFVDLQDDYETYIMIADYHALTSVKDPAELRMLTHELVLTYLGIGIDPEKVTLFRQSDVTGHTELAWIFDCITTMPYLMRGHAFKDAEAKDHEINVGVFNYPMLMAADILLYDADVVPVGKDQKQHIEYTRDTAQKFNNLYGETFKLPKELIIDDVETVPGTDGQKMSKSYKNVIPLFGTDEEIQKAVMGIVTDSGMELAIELPESGDPKLATFKTKIPINIWNIYRLFKDDKYINKKFINGEGKYKAIKESLIADILEFVTPMRKRREEYANNPELVAEILRNGAEKARAKAQVKMTQVRKAVGLE